MNLQRLILSWNRIGSEGVECLGQRYIYFTRSSRNENKSQFHWQSSTNFVTKRNEKGFYNLTTWHWLSCGALHQQAADEFDFLLGLNRIGKLFLRDRIPLSFLVVCIVTFGIQQRSRTQCNQRLSTTPTRVNQTCCFSSSCCVISILGIQIIRDFQAFWRSF